MRFPAKITSSCIWVAIPGYLLILHWYACGADGWSGGRAYGDVITKISRMGRSPNFRTHGALLRARGAPLRKITLQRNYPEFQSPTPLAHLLSLRPAETVEIQANKGI